MSYGNWRGFFLAEFFVSDNKFVVMSDAMLTHSTTC